MTGCGTVTLTIPDNCRVNVPGASLNLVVTAPGDFKMSVTWVKLRRVRLIGFRENLSRIAFVTLTPGLTVVGLPTLHGSLPTWSGVKLSRGEIVLHGLDERIHQQTDRETRWGLISLAADDLAAYCRVLSGVDLITSVAAKILRPPSAAVTHLLRLHGKVCRLAEREPELVGHREVARALEQDLLHALVNCLTGERAQEGRATNRRHAEIMVRFEDVLAAHDDQQLSMAEVCAAIAVRERTLRVCCAEFLGMSPSSYIRLRRLNLVRAALRQADPATTSVATLARRFGFSELGRFAVVYRTVFGETPSATLGAPSKIRDLLLPNSHRRHIPSSLTLAPTGGGRAARRRRRGDDLPRRPRA